jgi:hypothetical protein
LARASRSVHCVLPSSLHMVAVHQLSSFQRFPRMQIVRRAWPSSMTLASSSPAASSAASRRSVLRLTCNCSARQAPCCDRAKRQDLTDPQRLLPGVRRLICQVYRFQEYLPVEPSFVHRCSSTCPEALPLYRAGRQPAHKVPLERKEDDQGDDQRNESPRRQDMPVLTPLANQS